MSNTPIDVDVLAQEIRRVDGNHDKGAGALAEALMPFLSAALQSAADTPAPQPTPVGYRWRGIGEWFYAPNAPEGVDAQPLYLSPFKAKEE